MNTLKKINPKIIEFNKKLQLYRAIPQGFLESDIFRSSAENKSPSYFARTGNGGTFVTNNLLAALGYARDWTAFMGFKEIPTLFTNYMAIFGIDVSPYLDKLYFDTSGNEGIIINGPIAIKDIEVLFCSDKNILDKINLNEVLLDNNEIYQRKKEDLLSMLEEPSITLVKRYNDNKNELVVQIMNYLKNQLNKKEIAKLLPKVISLLSSKY